MGLFFRQKQMLLSCSTRAFEPAAPSTLRAFVTVSVPVVVGITFFSLLVDLVADFKSLTHELRQSLPVADIVKDCKPIRIA